LLEFIPVVGPLVAAVVIVGVALLMTTRTGGAGNFSGHVAADSGLRNSPRIMGRSMELHPLAAIFGVMAGGELRVFLAFFFRFR